MARSKLSVAYWTVTLVIPIVLVIGSTHGQMRQARAGEASARPTPPAPIRATMSDLHAHGGVPRGWKFLMPPGDAAEGRTVFVSLECFACHEVRGESFPQTSKTPRGTGPDLTGMGGHHPAEYFAESIVNPNRVIVQGEGYTGADGLSKMPSYADTMTIKQLVDVVAYLKSLTTGEMTHDHGHMSRSMTSGDSMKMK
jgi:mono/diheme cytochrome c family protein